MHTGAPVARWQAGEDLHRAMSTGDCALLPVCEQLLANHAVLHRYASGLRSHADLGPTHAAGAVSAALFLRAMDRATRMGTTPGELLVRIYSNVHRALCDCLLCACMVDTAEELLHTIVHGAESEEHGRMTLELTRRVLSYAQADRCFDMFPDGQRSCFN